MTVSVAPTTTDRQPLPPFSGWWDAFRLPREHGAVVNLFLSSILCLRLAGVELAPAGIMLLVFWLSISTMHRLRLSLLVSSLGALALWADTGNLPAALATLSIGVTVTAGNRALLALGTRYGAAWRESAGMLAVSVMPLAIPPVVGGEFSLPAALCLAASSVLATGTIHLLRRDPHRSLYPSLVLAPVLWGCLLLVSRGLFALCLAPFLVQGLLLFRRTRPSFKMLGVIATLSMVWVAGVVWISITRW